MTGNDKAHGTDISGGHSHVPHRTFPGVHHCDGLFWLGNVDWWYHNRGHSSTRLASRLARYVPTVWVNSIGMRMPVPGKTEIAWTRYFRKMRSVIKGLKRDRASGMWIYSPVFVARYSRRCLEWNGFLLSLQLRCLAHHLRIDHPSVSISMPTMTPAVERMRCVRVLFDRCDDFAALPEANRSIVTELEDRLLAICDCAIYVNQHLWEREKHVVKNSRLIQHGVDFDRLVRFRPLKGARPPTPNAMRNLCRPIVGFYGGMDEYRMDVSLMIKVARSIQPGTLLLIGPAQMDLKVVKEEPNVRHIGQLPPEELGRYAAHFDVGIIPFLQNDFNYYCNPVKLKEYLALAFPIVTTRLPAFEPFHHLIYLADSHEQFLHQLQRALQENDLNRAVQRRRAVVEGSWKKVADSLAPLLAIPIPGNRKLTDPKLSDGPR